MKKTTRREGGQAIIELVLVLPLIMLLIFVILDCAILMDRSASIDQALREGTRTAASGSSVAQTVQRTVDQSDGLLAPGDIVVCYEDIDGNGNPGDVGDNVRVSVVHTYDFVLGSELLDTWGVSKPSITMDRTAHDRVEQDIAGAPEC
jgi:hypothetical protein